MATAITRAVVANTCRIKFCDCFLCCGGDKSLSVDTELTDFCANSNPHTDEKSTVNILELNSTLYLSSCSCIVCDRSFSQSSIKSFKTANLSSSTTFVNESDSSSTITLQRSSVEFKANTFIASAALGQLKQKQSPIFGSLRSPKSFSLRTGESFYTRHLLSRKDVGEGAPSRWGNKLNLIDFTATEAKMETTRKSNQEKKYQGELMDINRNGASATQNGTIMTSPNTEKREHLYKILVIGELGTGKTSFIKRYVHQFFSQNYRATIGVDFALKVLHWDANTIVRLQLWDIAGQERFGNMTRVYYKEAVGAFIVFDVTRSGTFDCVSKWKEDLDSKVQLPDGSPIPCILLANKCDQEKQGIVTTPEKMEEYVNENGFAGWFETSAKENINIDEAARALVNKILINDKLISAADLADGEKFNLNHPGDQTTASETKNKCSC